MTVARSVEGEGYDYSRTVFEMESPTTFYDVG